VLFPSLGWLEAAVAVVNRHPSLPEALRGLGRDLAAVVEADPPALRVAFAVYGCQEKGRIGSLRLLADPDDILELEPAYVLRAPYRVWRALLEGEDPVKAALTGRVRVEGDLPALIRRARYSHIIEGALASLETEFAEAGGNR
jgi:SCP-2 sterol transfer family